MWNIGFSSIDGELENSHGMAGFRPRLAFAGTQDESVLTVFDVGREHDSSRVMQPTAVAMVEIVFFEGAAIDAGLDGARVGAGENKGADGPAGEFQAAFGAGSVSAEEFLAAEASPEAAAYFSPFGDVVLPCLLYTSDAADDMQV